MEWLSYFYLFMEYAGSGASGSTFYIFSIRRNRYVEKWKIHVDYLGFAVEPSKNLT